MEFIKKKDRSYIRIENPDGISRILTSNVNLHKLFLKDSDDIIPVGFIDQSGKNELILNFNEELKSFEVSVYTLSARHIELELEVIEKLNAPYPDNSYVMRIKTCLVAEGKRRFKRYDARQMNLYVDNIIILKVRECSLAITNSVRFHIFFLECEKKLMGYDCRKVLFWNDKNLSPEIKYVIDKTGLLCIQDFKRSNDFFIENKDLFKEKPDMPGALKRTFADLGKHYQSLIIQPIEYITIEDEKFTIGCIMAGSRDRVIDEDDLKEINSLAEETSRKIIDSNFEAHKVKWAVLDISEGGVMIDITNEKIAKRISSQDGLIFSIELNNQQTVEISGEVAYIFKKNDSSYIMGVEFKGTKFDDSTRKLIKEYIKSNISLCENM